MPTPVSPYSQLLAAVQGAAVLNGVKVVSGHAELARVASPPRIVLVPKSGRYQEPRDNRALSGVVLTVDAFIWASNYDQSWDVFARLLQAVRGATTGTGYTWQFLTLDYDIEPDATRQGVLMTVTFATRIDVSPATGDVTVVVQTVTVTNTNT